MNKLVALLLFALLCSHPGYLFAEAAEKSATASPTKQVTVVNLNTADANQLTQLPGIGPAKAKAIVAFREKQGGFTYKEDLVMVKGVSEKLFKRLENQIKVK